MDEARGLEIRPKLQPVLGQRVVIGRFVQVGIGVQSFGAATFQNLRKLVGLNVFLRLSNCILPCLLQVFQLLVIPAHRLIPFRDVGGIRLLHLGERGFFGGVVGGANFVRALESHVFKHVGHSGLAQGILNGSDVHVGTEGEHRSFRTLINDDC